MDNVLCKVTYLDRGAEGDSIEVIGDEIAELGRPVFEVRVFMISYHRIILI